MAETKSTRLNPHKDQASYSPLELLVRSVLRRFGDVSMRVDPDVMLMMIEYGNRVIEDIKDHPYRSGTASPDYYITQTDTRPVPDLIMQAGLLAYYAIDQGSEKAQLYYDLYAKTMNRILYERKYGNTTHSLSVVDR